MGTLVYGQSRAIDFEDRVLAHLQIVVSYKLRRGESFMMSWWNTADSTSARSALWMHPAIALQFEYTSRIVPTINREWLQELSAAANTPQGLVLSTDANAGAQSSA